MAFTSKYENFTQDELNEMFTINGETLKDDICILGFIYNPNLRRAEIGFIYNGTVAYLLTQIMVSELDALSQMDDETVQELIYKDLIKKAIKYNEDSLRAMSRFVKA